MSRTYDWTAVRSVPATTLEQGEVCITPSTGTAYHVFDDGTVTGVGWQTLDGTTWTVTDVDTTGRVTARTETDRTVSQLPGPQHKVLRFVAA